MLSRLAAQAARPPMLRTMATRRPAQSILASRAWTRGMAKDNKPRFNTPQGNQTNPRSTNPPPPQTTHQKPLAARPTPPPAPEPAADPRQTAPQPGSAESSSQQPESAEKDTTEPNQIPFSSLPDITQGLPSTLEYESAGASKASRLALEGVPTSTGGRGKGELPASAYISSSERKRQALANWMFGIFCVSTVLGTVYLGRNWEDEAELAAHPDVPNGWGLGLWWSRASTRIKEMLNYYQEPAFEKLLPDPAQPYERPYTLCISLEDMLVHSEWSREHGWRLAKRPGMDYFIRYLQQYYEIVLFTSVPFAMGDPIWRKVEPYHIVYLTLWREGTKYKDGKIVKDLSYLNRDLSKVIILDTNLDHVSAQPENAILLPKWTGDPKDRDLVSLVPFLEYIAAMQLPDTREVLKSFPALEGNKIPEEFARREAVARKRFQERLEAERRSHPLKGKNALGAVGNMLGLKASRMSVMVPAEGEETLAEGLAQGKMLQDIARERGQRNYEFLEQQIRENGAQWLKEEQEATERMQKEAMEGMKGSFSGFFGGGGAAPPPAAPASPEKKEEKKDDDKKP